MSWMCGVMLSSSTSRKNTVVNHATPIHANSVVSTTPGCQPVAAAEVQAYFHTAIIGIHPVTSNTANTEVRHWTKTTVNPSTSSKVILRIYTSALSSLFFQSSYLIYTPVNICDFYAVTPDNTLPAQTRTPIF
jgi:hypothetical protein